MNKSSIQLNKFKKNRGRERTFPNLVSGVQSKISTASKPSEVRISDEEGWPSAGSHEISIRVDKNQAFTKTMFRYTCSNYSCYDYGADGTRKISFLFGPHEPLLATVTRRKRAWFGYVTRHDSLSKTILLSTLEGWRRQGQKRKCWMDNIKEWTSLPMPELLARASCRSD